MSAASASALAIQKLETEITELKQLIPSPSLRQVLAPLRLAANAAADAAMYLVNKALDMCARDMLRQAAVPPTWDTADLS